MLLITNNHHGCRHRQQFEKNPKNKNQKKKQNPMIGNKTLCDICSSKAIRKARMKKEKETSTQTPNIEPNTETIDELASTTVPPTPSMPTQHHHDEGIFPK